MRKNIKAIIFLFISLGYVFGSSDYSVTIRVEDIQWRDGYQEWRCYLYADVFYLGELVEDMSNFSFQWYDKRSV